MKIILAIIITFSIQLINAQALRDSKHIKNAECPYLLIKDYQKTSFAFDSYTQDFENYLDFTVNFLSWTTNDMDNWDTYGFEDYEFPNEYMPLAFIVFNPQTTSPSMTQDSDIQPHSGNRFAASFSATTPPNNDWLISPEINLGNNSKLKMWVKSYTEDYGLERYKVFVSTTNANPDNFIPISGTLEAPANAWTEVEFDLANYDNQQIYIGINCKSYDAFVFMVDDIIIETETDSLKTPSDLSYVLNNGNGQVTMSWDFEDDKTSWLPKSSLEEFNIYRNSEIVGNSIINEYTDLLPEPGQFSYTVTAKYFIAESGHSNTINVNWAVGLNEMTEKNLSFSPNPVNDQVYISSGFSIEEVVVMNITGKILSISEPFLKHMKLNLSDYHNGIYLIRIKTEAGETIRKISKL